MTALTGARPRTRSALPAAAFGAIVMALAFAIAATAAGHNHYFVGVVVLLALPALAYIAWYTDPAWFLIAGLLLSTFSGNWDQFGLPSLVAPDRLALGLAAGVTLFRIVIGEYPAPRPRPVYWLMAVVVVYALASAFLSGTDDRDAMIRLFDRLGVVPFVVFALAPTIFRESKHRDAFLVALVAWGGYLGLTAVFEGIGLKSLVFPRYILDPNFGAHADRARGPFVEAVTNGLALYGCFVAGVIAARTWQKEWARTAAGAVAVLCLFGILFTLTRSVWIGAAAASLVACVAVKELRRYAIAAPVAGAVLIAAALVVVPGLRDKVTERADKKETVWERENVNRAALNMIAARPLLGFGWNTFTQKDIDYFELSPTRPLQSLHPGTALHNAFLANAVELGLVGASLWLLTTLIGVGGTVLQRGPPELRPWRLGLGAYLVCWLVVSNFVNPLAFPTLLLWTWAGVLAAGQEEEARESARAPARVTAYPKKLDGTATASP